MKRVFALTVLLAACDTTGERSDVITVNPICLLICIANPQRDKPPDVHVNTPIHIPAPSPLPPARKR